MSRADDGTAVCSLGPSVATQRMVINPVADTGSLSQEPTIAVVEQYAEALGYGQPVHRVDVADEDNTVAVTIYMPKICDE